MQLLLKFGMTSYEEQYNRHKKISKMIIAAGSLISEKKSTMTISQGGDSIDILEFKA